MTVARANIKKQLQEGLNAVFGLEYAQYAEQWKDIFTMSKEGRKAYVEDVLMTGTGAAGVKAEGAPVAYDSMSESYVSRYVFETIAMALSFSEESLEDNLYGDLGAKGAKAMARSMQHTKNVKGASILNNGFSASFTGGDGVALFSTAHPLKSGGTAANKLTTDADLSETSLEDLLILMGNATDDRGLKIPVNAKKLIVPNALQFVAPRILKSDKRVGTADNDLNSIRSELGLGFAVNKYLTDDDAFFLVTDAPDGLKYIERTPIKKNFEGDFESGNGRYRCRERYVFGWSDWRGAYGSAGA